MADRVATPIRGSDSAPLPRWSAPLQVTLADGTVHPVRGRRAAFIRHLVLRGEYLDAPWYRVGKLELSWCDGKKLDVACTRLARDPWPPEPE